MYSVAGIYLGRANSLPLVEQIGRVELWVALAAWLIVFLAMARHIIATVLLSPGLKGSSTP